MNSMNLLFEIDELKDALVGRDIEIDRLRQQLAECQTAFTAMKGEWEKAYEIGVLAKQQLAECQANVASMEDEKEHRYVEQILRPIRLLIALARSAETLADNSIESDGQIVLGMPSDFEALGETLDGLDGLPDDKPGYTLSAAAKAAWALRDLLGENYD